MWLLPDTQWILLASHFLDCLLRLPPPIPQLCAWGLSLTTETCSAPAGPTRKTRELMLPRTAFNQWQELMNRHSNSGLIFRPISSQIQSQPTEATKGIWPAKPEQVHKKSSPDPIPKGPIAIYPHNCTPRRREWPDHSKTVWYRVWVNHQMNP